MTKGPRALRYEALEPRRKSLLGLLGLALLKSDSVFSRSNLEVGVGMIVQAKNEKNASARSGK